MTISLPAAFRKAFVQRTFRGLRFILKFLWHFDWGQDGGHEYMAHRQKIESTHAAKLKRLGVVSHKHGSCFCVHRYQLMQSTSNDQLHFTYHDQDIGVHRRNNSFQHA